MKKLFALALAASMAVSMVACSSSGDSGSAASETKTGEGQGYGGTITATVTVEGDTITAVTFDGPNETETIGGAALEKIAEQIVAANGTEIDGVSGATVTTEGCIEAVNNAMGK